MKHTQERKIMFRTDEITYQNLKKVADYFNVSINHEIQHLIDCCLMKWNKKKVSYNELPTHIQQIQDNNWENEYNQALMDIKSPIKARK